MAALISKAISKISTSSVRTFCVGVLNQEDDKNLHRRRELDTMGAWNSGAGLKELKEESSLLRGTLIPKVAVDQVGISIHRGRRAYQEDRHVVSDQIGIDLGLDLRLLAVFDGHGGAECSQFCADNIEKHISKQITIQLDKEPHKGRESRGPHVDITVAMQRAIMDINNAFKRYLEKKKVRKGTVGTTATIALIRDGYELVVAQIGDSRALLLRGDDFICLTEDHCASNPVEKKRIESCGGKVDYDEVGRHLVNKKLAMSRSIGDFELKPYGVTCEPSFIRTYFKHYKDSSLVIVTDGITFVMSNEEIAKTVSQYDDPSEAAEKLVEQALLHAGEDNITVIVLPLGSWGKYTTQSGPNPIMSLGRNMALSSRFG